MTTMSPVTSSKPAPQRRALAAVLRLEDQLELVLLAQLRQQIPRAVLRPVVDDDELDAHRDGEHARDDLLDRLPLVVDGHDHGQQRIGEDPFQSRHQVVSLVQRPGSA